TFLKDFNVEWQQMLQERQFNLREIAVNKQFEFYQKNLKTFEYKIVVIISDAFRYELGQELYQELVTDAKNTVNIEPYLASIPSNTNLGMTNLLPHDAVTVEKGEKDLVFKING
ncbi:PglZ domain-containing protein, partial [Arthrospira platensis SPKY1]|nr:PglZ domain-containing protein [Arthrospira platensis SPKY1]